MTPQVHTDRLAVMAGMVLMSLEGTPMVLQPLRNAMREPARFNAVFTPVFGFVIALYIMFGYVGYATIGEAVHTPVTEARFLCPFVS